MKGESYILHWSKNWTCPWKHTDEGGSVKSVMAYGYAFLTSVTTEHVLHKHTGEGGCVKAELCILHWTKNWTCPWKRTKEGGRVKGETCIHHWCKTMAESLGCVKSELCIPGLHQKVNISLNKQERSMGGGGGGGQACGGWVVGPVVLLITLALENLYTEL